MARASEQYVDLRLVTQVAIECFSENDGLRRLRMNNFSHRFADTNRHRFFPWTRTTFLVRTIRFQRTDENVLFRGRRLRPSVLESGPGRQPRLIR